MKGFRLITPLLALTIVALGAVAAQAQDCPKVISGAIFTTDKNGTVVNGNIYKNCCDVYLNGGPPPNAPCTSAGLPDGDYYYMVTDPSGKILLSSDDISHRKFTVKNGVMVWAAGPFARTCNHTIGVGKCGSPTVSVQLMPFSETPNPGGEYKAWATPICRYDSANAGRNDVAGEKWGFVHRYSKTDNFKCHPAKVCHVNCPPNVDNVCADDFPGCTATVNVPPPTTDCPDPVFSVSRSDGAPISYSNGVVITGPFPIGTTEIDWLVSSSGLAQPVPCLQWVTVIDCNPPHIHCPDNITVQLKCSEVGRNVDFEATADDCSLPVTIVYKDQDGNVVTPGQFFFAGHYVITATATDNTGLSSSCKFNIDVKLAPPCCLLQAFKFNDLNGDGKYDPVTEKPLGGVQFTIDYIDSTDGSAHHCVQCTDPITGTTAGVLVPDGSSFTITEIPPSTGNSNCNWVPTTPTTVTGTVNGASCPDPFAFGNICQCSPSGGFTPGYWSNKNGEAVLSANDPAWRTLLNSLCLRDDAGNIYQVPGGAFGDDNNPGAYANFRDWLLGANAVNMAYKLSQMLAASTLNGAYKGLSDSTVLVLPSNLATCYGKATVTMGEVRAAAKAELCAHGYTPSSGPGSEFRAYQECLKNILDGTNNNTIPFLGGDCPIANACSPANDVCTP